MSADLRERLIAALHERPASAYLWTAESLDDDANADEFQALALDKSAEVVADVAMEALLTWRDEAFGPGNDKVWGPGQWVRCEACPDGTGLPSYHHKAFHQ